MLNVTFYCEYLYEGIDYARRDIVAYLIAESEKTRLHKVATEKEQKSKERLDPRYCGLSGQGKKPAVR